MARLCYEHLESNFLYTKAKNVSLIFLTISTVILIIFKLNLKKIQQKLGRKARKMRTKFMKILKENLRKI